MTHFFEHSQAFQNKDYNMLYLSQRRNSICNVGLFDYWLL